MSTITKPITVEEYERMIADGTIAEDDPIELIEGELVPKMTKGDKHSASSEHSWRAIHLFLPVGWHVRIEKPVRIPTRDSEPEPDVSVARGGIDDYLGHRPGPADIALVVEVAESSLAKDRALAATYGGAGVPVYWIVNIPDRQLEVYAHPVAGEYSTAISIDETGSVDLIIDGQVVGAIPVADLLPRKEATP